MLTKTDDDSSSSEDEINKDALKEAADHDFLKDTYFSGTSKTEKTESRAKSSVNESSTQLSNLKSLRKEKEEEHFTTFGVTPSFQSFVAKKLDEIIERNIKLKKKTGDNNPPTENTQDDSNTGIKLLHSSKNLLTAKPEVEEPIKYKKRKKQDETLIESENAAKCKEVAVEPGWVISKAGTKGWTPKRTDLEFKYKKLKNGVLIERE